MKLAFISDALPYLPSRGGFRLYGGNLIRQLSQRHTIDLISFVRDDDAQHLDWPKQYCTTVHTIPANGANLSKRLANVVAAHLWGRPLVGREQLLAPLRHGIAAGKWDVLHVEATYAGALIPAELPIPKVLSLHDSWTLRAEEMLECAQDWREKLYYRFLKYHEPRFERLVYPRYERCTVVADRDVAEIRKTVPNAKVDLIPYGTDTEYFHPVDVEKQPMTLVFHSHLSYSPNVEAALEFANDIFPLIRREVPGATFHLVGASPGPRIQELASRPGIKILANLPDLRPAVCSGQIYVCAIRHGTGLKSKMLEAMAMRMPIVCYPGSTVGLEAAPGQHFLLARNPQEFAAQALHLLRDPRRADELARAGRQLVEERYSWATRARAYEELYARVIEERQTRFRRPA